MTKKAEKPAEEQELEEVTAEQQEEQKTAEKKTAKKTSKKKEAKADKASEKEEDKASVENEKVNELEAEVKELKQRLEDAEQSSGEWHNKYLRLSAEFDNYRKRTLQEKADLTKMANADLLNDLLKVVDDFERSMDHMDKSEDVEALKEGVHLIYNKFVEFIGQNGLKEIEAKELDFDLDFHEAITKIPAPTEELKGKVVDVIEKGYTLNDKVIRYAKVVVGE